MTSTLIFAAFMVGGVALIYWLLHPAWLEEDDE